MICANCGKEMREGIFKVFSTRETFIYFSLNGETICSATQKSTTGFYCPECDILIGAFKKTKPVGFMPEYNNAFDDEIDCLPQKTCPDCAKSIDIDYPVCPECRYKFIES